MKLIFGERNNFLKADACYFAIYGKIVASVKVENDPGANYWRMLLYNPASSRKYPILIFSEGIVPTTWPLPVYVEGYVNVRDQSVFLVGRRIWDEIEIAPNDFSVHKWQNLQFSLFRPLTENSEPTPSRIYEMSRNGLFGGQVRISHADSAFDTHQVSKEEEFTEGPVLETDGQIAGNVYPGCLQEKIAEHALIEDELDNIKDPSMDEKIRNEMIDLRGLD
jgi:hypothetical protein